MKKEKDNESIERMRRMCAAIWEDYRAGKADYETLDLGEYGRTFGVGKFPKCLIAPLMLKRTAPDAEDAIGLRVEINRYTYSKRNPDREELKREQIDVQTAVAMLKGKGYRVMKKTTAYIDL